MNPRAQRDDCRGCRSESFHDSPKGCWCFPHAVIVSKLRLKDGDPIEKHDVVQVPNCFNQPGYLHLTPAPKPGWQSRSDWEGGDAA